MKRKPNVIECYRYNLHSCWWPFKKVHLYNNWWLCIKSSKSYRFSLLVMTYSSSSLMNAKNCCICLNIFFGTLLRVSILQIDSDFGKSMFWNFTNVSESNEFWKDISSNNHSLIFFSRTIKLPWSNIWLLFHFLGNSFLFWKLFWFHQLPPFLSKWQCKMVYQIQKHHQRQEYVQFLPINHW